MVRFIECKNCLSSFEKHLDRCPVCGLNVNNNSGAKIVFNDETRSEISKLGGTIDEFLGTHDGKVVIIPCEMGVLRFDPETGFKWTNLLLSVVEQVSFKNSNLEVRAGGINYILSLENGKIIPS